MMSLTWLVSFLSVLVQVEQCNSRSTAHAPRSRLHKLDCKVSRQKVIGASGDEGVVLVIGAHVGNSRANEEQWKYLSSKKMTNLWKVFVEPFPDHFSQLQTNIRKGRMVNATAVHAAIFPSPTLFPNTSSPASGGDTALSGAARSVDLYCHSFHTHERNIAKNASISPRLVPKRQFCSLDPHHPHFKRPFSAGNTTEGSSSGGSRDDKGVWSLKVPAMSLTDLFHSVGTSDVQGGSEGGGAQRGGRVSAVRLLILDTDDDVDFKLLHELPYVNENSPLFRPSVISVNYGTFSQEQLEASLRMLHQLEYMTCVAKKRKGQHLHAFQQRALLKLKDVQFL